MVARPYILFQTTAVIDPRAFARADRISVAACWMITGNLSWEFIVL
jgi:hypothetical protein